MCISATAARAFKSVLQGILLSSEGYNNFISISSSSAIGTFLYVLGVWFLPQKSMHLVSFSFLFPEHGEFSENG